MARDGFFSVLFFCLLCFTVRSTLQDCQRSCDSRTKPKTCFYEFLLGISQRGAPGDVGSTGRRFFLSINKKWPPPVLNVCLNDTIVVEVRNELPLGIETSIHWHGIGPGNSPFMDGVPMITQCPINSHQSFRYHLRANKVGAFFYRSHSVVQQLDGLFGPVIIRGDDKNEPTRLITISPVLKNLQTFNDGFETDLSVKSLELIVYNELHARSQNESVLERLHIINLSALNCPVTLYSIAATLTVVSIDGNIIEPKTTQHLTVYPGERITVLTSKGYAQSIRVLGRDLCRNQVKFGLNAGYSEERTQEEERNFPENAFRGTMLDRELDESDLSVFLPYDVTVMKDFKGKVDFRFKLGGLTPYAPSFLDKDLIAFYQTNNKTFLYPTSSLLSQYDDVPENIMCDLKNPSQRCLEDDNDYCECLGVINLPYNKKVDLFIIDEGTNSNVSQTVHIHGHTFHVLASKAHERPIHAAEIEEEDRLGKYERNLVNPIEKDSVLVPNKGFVILRLVTNNPGAWLVESTTSKAQSAVGFEYLLLVDAPGGKIDPPDGFPRCGTLKGQDLVIIDN